MNVRWTVLMGAVAFAGCVSLSAQIPTRPPAGRTAAEVAQDESQCERYAKETGGDKRSLYRACMVARSYAANVWMDDLDRFVGLVQTRPHDASEVIRDAAFCDHRADSAKNSDIVSLTPEQERSVAAAQVHTMNPTRPNATRMLVSCLQERGYAITPWVR